MKQVVCYVLFFLFTITNALAQKNIFFKKEKSKYTLTTNKQEPLKNEQPQFSSKISIHETSLLVNRRFSLYMPKAYVSSDSRDAILYILGLGGSILGSIYADKLHYNYRGDFIYPATNYRQNSF